MIASLAFPSSRYFSPSATAFCIFASGLCAQPTLPRATSPTTSRTTDRPDIFRAVGFTAAPRRGRTSHKSRDWFDVGEGVFVGNLITVGRLAHRVKRARIHPANSRPYSVQCIPLWVVVPSGVWLKCFTHGHLTSGRPLHSGRSPVSREGVYG